jgi:hypothetical protein
VLTAEFDLMCNISVFFLGLGMKSQPKAALEVGDTLGLMVIAGAGPVVTHLVGVGMVEQTARTDKAQA